MAVTSQRSIASGMARVITHEFKEWPAWYYGPNGQSAIFHNAEEIPEGWGAHPNEVAKNAVAIDPTLASHQSVDVAAKVLAETYSQGELLAHLKVMQESNSSIEFMASWPKIKLATVIVANGSAGPDRS